MSEKNETLINSSVFDPQKIGTSTVELIEERSVNPGGGVKVGLPKIDAYLNGHRPGELRSLIAFTSNGKSTIANHIARNEARNLAGGESRKVVVSFIWEQAVEEQGIGDIAQLEGLNITRLVRGELTPDEWKKLRRGAAKRGSLPWWIVGHSISANSGPKRNRRPKLSMTDVIQAMEFLYDDMNLEVSLVVLDYLQRIRFEGQSETRIEYSKMVDRAKDMAIDFGVPVLLLSQATRKIKERKWQLPQVNDGAETSNLEHSSDSIITAWMPKTAYPERKELEYGDKVYVVTKSLLILGVMKQKFGDAPEIFELDIYPNIGKIVER